MAQRVLVATDGSEGGERAVDAAAELAKLVDAELIIVNVEQGYLRGDLHSIEIPDRPDIDDVLYTNSSEIIRRAEYKAKSRGAYNIRSCSGLGDPVAFILEIAREESPEFIVIGKRGRGQLAGLMLGSVSHKLVSLATCKVLVVP